MRICYLADGRSAHFHRWLKYFAGRGYEMSFISYQPINDERVKQIEQSGASYIGAVGPFHVKKFWKTLHSLWWLKKACRESKIDILHCHFLSFNAWYAALSGFHPLVITIMGGGDVCGPDWKPQGARPDRSDAWRRRFSGVLPGRETELFAEKIKSAG